MEKFAFGRSSRRSFGLLIARLNTFIEYGGKNSSSSDYLTLPEIKRDLRLNELSAIQMIENHMVHMKIGDDVYLVNED